MRRRHVPAHPPWCVHAHGADAPHSRVVGQAESDRAVLDVALSQDPRRAPVVVLAVHEPERSSTFRLAPAQARALRDALAASLVALESEA